MSDGAKGKFVIKPFRPSVQMNHERATQIWEALHAAIREIHNKNASSLSFEELYRNAYNLVLHKHGELLFNGVKGAVTEHLSEVAAQIASRPDEQLLVELTERWDDHKVTMVMIRDIMMYMDRTYVVQQKQTPVYDLGLIIFREVVLEHTDVRDRLRGIVLGAVAAERNGEVIDRMQLKGALGMLQELGVNSSAVYEEHFERSFLEATATFYRHETQTHIVENAAPDYVRKAEARLREEQQRVAHYLAASTEAKLLKVVETEVVERHAQALIDMEHSGCAVMFDDGKTEDLKRMFALFSRVPKTLLLLQAALSKSVRTRGTELVRDQDEQRDPVTFVQSMLNLRDKYDAYVTQAFRKNKDFAKTLKEAFESFVNADARVASYLAQYADDLLRSKLRGLSEDEVEVRLDKVVVLFRYLQDKDIFESYYKQHLAKRLITGRSVSSEAERSMLSKLKAECGYMFTSKLEGMFKDMGLSRETMEQYRQHARQAPTPAQSGTGGDIVPAQAATGSDVHPLLAPPVEMVVNVLTTGFWPIKSAQPCVLPPAIQSCCEHFKQFYCENKHKGRRLTWQTNMGTADLKANFGASGERRHELNCSTYQMCILLLFNRSAVVSFRDIKAATAIQPESELKRHLISLCTPKHRILVKGSKGKVIGDDDTFTFNANFKSKMKRVRIALVAHKETKTVAAVPAPVQEDRRHLLEASIVRIMKTRKALQHNNLIAEVTKQLSSRFVPAPQLIKKRIESLIEREYLERSKDDSRVYNYLA